MRLLRQPAPALLAATFLAVAAGPARAQDFLEAYQAGVEAIEAEDWESAERHLEVASEARAEPAERLLRYLHFKPYVPWFYLGLARYRTGNCPGALDAWDESERQGVAPGLDELWPAVVEGRAQCALYDRMQEDAQREAAELTVLLERAERAAEAAAALAPEARAAGVWERGDPAPADRLRRAEEEIAAARRLVADLEEGDVDPAALPELASEAEARTRRALQILGGLRSQVESRREEVRARVGSERNRLTATRSAAVPLLEETEALGETVPRIAAARTALQEALAEAETLPPDAPLVELERHRRRIAGAAEALREVAAPPPEALLEAANAFFAGELERAVEILERPGIEDSPDPRVRAHAALLRAASRFSLWQVGGSADLDLLEAARQDVAAAREEDPDLTPLPRAFSPRFLAFFETNAPEPPDEDG